MLKRIFIFVATLIFAACLPYLAFAQFRADTLSVEMYSPEASSLMTYTDYPVSHMTGTPDISIPLYSIISGTLELPLALKFHMGDYLRSNQPAGTIGAGWSLTTDFMVTRKIKGLDDFNENGYLYKGDLITENEDYWNVTRKMALGTLDGEPDRYYFKTLDGAGNFYVLNGGNHIEQVPSGPEKIEFSAGFPPINSNRFVITDAKGRTYRYEGEAGAADKIESDDDHWTAWRCSEITDDTEADIISFSYISDHSRTVFGTSSGVAVLDSLPTTYPALDVFDIPRLDTGGHDYPYFLYPNQETGVGYKWYPDSIRFSKSPHPQPSAISSHLVSRIDFRGGYLTFSYSTHYKVSDSPGLFDPFYVLDSIRVFTSSSSLIHSYEFLHNTDMKDRYNVFLSEIIVDGTLHYQFTNPATQRGSGSSDFWGYGLYDHDANPHAIDCQIHIASGNKRMHYGYNELIQGSSSPALNVDNVTSPIYLFGDGESCFSIRYPTGGQTVFTYEYDRFCDDYDGSIKKISSKRIKRIAYFDTDGSILKETKYTYSDGTILHKPSGRLSFGPVNTVLSQIIRVCNTKPIQIDNGGPFPETYNPGVIGDYRKRTFLAGVVFDDEFTTGNWINYPEVTETIMDGSIPIGKTVYKYDVEGPNGSPGIITFSTELAPYPIAKQYWYMGTSRQVCIFEYKNGAFNPVEKIEYTWNTFLKNNKIKVARIWPYVLSIDITADSGTDNRLIDASQYSYSIQNLDLGHNRLLQEKKTEWMDDGTVLITTKEYKYDNPDSLTLGRIVTRCPDGTIQTEVFVHENDYSPLSNIEERPTYLTEYVRLINGTIAEGWAYNRDGSRIFNVYTLDCNNLSASSFKLSSCSVHGIFDGSCTPTTAMTLDSHYSVFDGYDYNTSYWTPSEISRRGQPTKHITWGYAGLYPIATTVGTHTTSATFLPLVGMTSLTTPDGISSVFTYNQYGRLIRTTTDNNTLIEYSYSLDSSTSPENQWIKTRSYLNNLTQSYADDITWYNGLGLPDQTIELGTNKDVIHPVVYDAMLRDDATSPLSYYTSNINHRNYRLSTASEQTAYYTSLYNADEAAQAFYGKEYESSPLGRLRAEWEPGTMGLSTSQLDAKKTTYAYVSNSAGEVRRMYHTPEGVLIAVSDYPAGTLRCVVKTDPDGRTLRIYSDGLGRTVLERRNDGTNNIDTYYAYDPMGRLRWVVTPEGVGPVISQQQVSPSSDIAKRYCYYYEYDNRGNVTFKQIPGAAPIRYTYDEGDRVLSMIDGNLAAAGDTLKYTYDVYGRETGKDIAGTNASAVSRTIYDAYPANIASVFAYDSSHLAGLATRLLTPIDYVTFEQERILNTSDYLDRVYYYDRLGRVIQTIEYDPGSMILLRTSRKHDLHGNVWREKVSTYSVSQNGSLAAMDSLETETFYDRRDHPTEQYIYFRGASEAYPPTMFFYDDLGRLSKVIRGDRLTDTYAYNIQGRDTDHKFFKDYYYGTADTLFVSKIRYYDSFNSDSTPYRNGSISSISSLYGSMARYTINYSYDGLGRLIVANSAGPIYNHWHYNDYIFSDSFGYDKNSNLVYEDYEFNAGGLWFDYYDPVYYNMGNHRNGYSYDANGNITAVPGEISVATYNLLNLPSSVTPSGGSAVTYRYSAGGHKLSASSGTTTYIYTGPFKYKDTGNGAPILETVNCAGDMRIERTSNGFYERRYYVKDHLGSTRLVINLSGTVLQQSDFTPYGRTIDNALIIPGNSPYLWCGKEYESFIDLPWYDSEARFLTTTGTFTGIDPLCEHNFHISPYAYCAGDPVNKVDPLGKMIRIWYYDGNNLVNFIYTGKENNIPQNEYVQSIIDVYNYNKSSWSNASFSGNSPSTDLVESADITVDVIQSSEHESMYYQGNGGRPIMIWNPYEGTLTDNGTVLSPATIFAHEADHALDDLSDHFAHLARVDMIDPDYDNKEEKRVITGSEQKTALANGDISSGMVTRTNHSGSTVYTISSTSNFIDLKATTYYHKHRKSQ